MRIVIFIDGSNFYHRLKFLTKQKPKFSLLDFNFIDFCSWLCGKDDLIEIRYYIGAIRRQNNNPKSEKMYADQQRLFFNLQRKQVKIILGQLIQHPDKSYHEKGVDVKLAVEMIRFARQDKYDVAYLLSSDTDLVPAVEEVLSFNKKVKYIGATDVQSFGLTKVASEYLILRPEDIEPFLPKILT
ncbi:NYN domain-containing protein [Candidatus Parcubacteria bacterium]|nr:NYN domain-containing protein [Candidatus Parcubacteria bacterium]